MSDGGEGGGAAPPAIKAFPGDRPVSCSALTSIVSATRPSSPGPRASLWPPRGRLLRSSPPPLSRLQDTVLPQISPPGLPPAPASLSPTQELAAVRPEDT